MSAGRAYRVFFMAGGSDGWGLSLSESGLLLRWLSLRLCLVRLAPEPKKVPLSEKIAFRCTMNLLKILSSGGMPLLAGFARLSLQRFAWPRLRLRALFLRSFLRPLF